MATKLSRFTQLIFGSGAGNSQIAEFGSLAAAAPQTYSGTTITPAIVQTLSNYLQGWFGAVLGANSPAIEDMNAICYLYAYQLSYLMQQGVPEWDTATNYWIGSIAQDGLGNLFVSLTGSGTSPNVGNALTSSANWKPLVGQTNIISINPSTQSPYAMAVGDNGKTFLVNSANAAMQFNLITPTLNFKFKVKDVGGLMNTNNCTIHRNGGTGSIAGVAADYIAQANGGEWEFVSDGTAWYIVGR